MVYIYSDDLQIKNIRLLGNLSIGGNITGDSTSINTSNSVYSSNTTNNILITAPNYSDLTYTQTNTNFAGSAGKFFKLPTVGIYMCSVYLNCVVSGSSGQSLITCSSPAGTHSIEQINYNTTDRTYSFLIECVSPDEQITFTISNITNGNVVYNLKFKVVKLYNI